MAKRTSHTTFCRITSHGSGGRAEILHGHSALTWGFSDPHLTSVRFKSNEIGEGVVVRILLSGKRRLIKSVQVDPKAVGVVTFKAEYADILLKEGTEYESVHGKRSPSMDVDEPLPEWLGEDHSPLLTAEDLAPLTETEEDISEWLTKTYVDKTDQRVLNTIKVLSNKRHVAVMMIGPSGYGKTSIPEQMAKDWEMEFLRWDCATVRDPEEFFGFRGAVDGSTMNEDGETIFSESEFTRKVQEGNVIIVLDELNRIDPYISNILFPLLDHAGRTNVVGHNIVVGPNVIFFATVNIGFQFTGTFTLDTALTNRFTAKIMVGALPSKIEKKVIKARGGVNTPQAEQIVKLMQGLRKLNEDGSLSVDASTRVSIQISELVGCGLDLKTAVLYTVVNGISKEESKLVVDQVNYALY